MLEVRIAQHGPSGCYPLKLGVSNFYCVKATFSSRLQIWCGYSLSWAIVNISLVS